MKERRKGKICKEGRRRKEKVKVTRKREKKNWMEEEEEELRNLKNSAEIWKYINKKRGKRKSIENSC